MVEKVMNDVKRYRMIEAGDTVIAGVSGGADSVCLLFVLLEIKKNIPFRLAVSHINHGVRKEAEKEASFVETLCRENKLPFYLTVENMKAYAKEHGLSQEEAGRQIRYQAFEEALKQEKEKAENPGTGEKIAVAHNSNDRAETMLFHLFRGTGLTGAGGIKPVSGKVIRPLLGIERAEIEAWLAGKNLSFCTDATNEQDIYARNRIRHHILPVAEQEICQGAVRHMNQAADYLLAAEELITEQTDLAKKNVTKTFYAEEANQGKSGGVRINIPRFLEYGKYLQGRILLSCLEDMEAGRKDITTAHVKNIQKLFLSEGSKEIHLPGGLAVYKEYDRAMIHKRKDGIFEGKTEYAVSIQEQTEVPGLGRVEITVFPYEKTENIPQKTYTKWFDYDKITRSILFRTRKSGDFLTINSKMDRKSLQDYFVNEKIPKEERDCFYVLAEGSHILWVPGHRISEYYKVSGDTRQILQVKVLTEERSHEEWLKK